MSQVVDIDDRSSDPHHTQALGDHVRSSYPESPGESDEVEAPRGIGDEISIQHVKMSPSHHAKDHRNESSPRNSIHPDDNTSVHSLPVAHVTNPEPTMHQRPSTARGAEFGVPPRSPTSFSRSQTPQEDMSVPQSHRRLRHRSGAEVGDNLCRSLLSFLN
jgi:hypothetical protein